MRNVQILVILLALTTSMVWAAPSVSIDSPENGEVINGNEVEISVSFVSSAARPVSRVEVSLDGKPVTERAYESPLAVGECAFLWDTLRTEDGRHRLDVQVFSGKSFLCATTSVVTVANQSVPDRQPERPSRDVKSPQVSIQSPREGDTVSGKVPVIIQAKDDSGKPPFISVFVDKSLKAITNREPFRYTWDSSEAENGPHEIHVSALDDAENRTVTPPVRIIVRNPVKVTRIIAEETAPAPKPQTDAMPLERPAPTTESARTDVAAAERFEVAHSVPSSRVQPLPPLPEPEMAVLVSGPTEVFLAAEPEVASARMDEPKKPLTTSMPRAEATSTVYVVRSGDALWTIARRYDTTVDALVEENGLRDPSLIRIGQKLRIPTGSNGATMVALRPVFDELGGRIGWDAKKHAVHAWAPGTEVRVWIGSVRAEVNNQKVVMERPAALQLGRTMVPRSFVTDSLGVD